MTILSSLPAELAVRSFFVLALAFMAELLLHRRAAAIRHMVWTSAFAVLVLLPLPTLLLPVYSVPPGSPLQLLDPGVAIPVAQPYMSTPLPVSAPARESIASARSIDLGRLALLMWAAGAALVCIRIARAFLALRNMRVRAVEWARPRLKEELHRITGVASGVRILVTDAATVPMSWGLLRHYILLPDGMSGWSDDHLRPVLLHEFFHIRRADVAAQLLANLACAVCWYNPLVWLAWRESVKDRERAADDLVLSTGVAPTDYAESLLSVARAMASQAATACLGVGMVGKSEVEARVRSILDPLVKRRAAGGAVVLTLAVVTLALFAVRTRITAPQRPLLTNPFSPGFEASSWAVEVEGDTRQYLSPLSKHGGSNAFGLYTSPLSGFYAMADTDRDRPDIVTLRLRRSGAPRSLGELVASYVLHPGESVMLSDLGRFGVKPLRATLVPDREPNPVKLRVVNHASSVELQVTETRSSFVLAFRNTSRKYVAGLVLGSYLYRGEGFRTDRMFGGIPAVPLIAPGAVRTENEPKSTLLLHDSQRVCADPNMVLWGVAFTDGTYEGDAGRLSNLQAQLKDRKEAGLRLVAALETEAANRRPTLFELKQAALSASSPRAGTQTRDVDPSALSDISGLLHVCWLSTPGQLAYGQLSNPTGEVVRAEGTHAALLERSWQLPATQQRFDKPALRQCFADIRRLYAQ